ncbi:MAG TPA: TonB family protein [Steroidobacteraceae bacterium]
MPAPAEGAQPIQDIHSVSVSAQKQAASEALAGPVPFAGGIAFAEKLVLLTQDQSLVEALASVVTAESLIVVADETELAQHLMSADTGVAFIDAWAGHSPAATAQLAQKLHLQLPDVVLVVAGDGAAQTELAALVGDGTIYRFVHKPVSAQRVKLFVDAAWRKREGHTASGLFPALSLPPPETLTPMPRESSWLPIAVGVAMVAVGGAWYLWHEPAQPVAPKTAARLPPPPMAPIAAPRPRPAPPVAAPRPQPAPPVVRAAEPPRPIPTQPLPIVAASPPTALAATVASTPEDFGPSSTPPVSEARDPLSVAAVILHRVYAIDPEFPEIARENDLAGYVDLEFTVHSDGSVSDVTVLKARPVGVFEKSAVAAVRQWRYQPIDRAGVPVTEHARLRLNFGYK